jgi:hypothetical protein
MIGRLSSFFLIIGILLVFMETRILAGEEFNSNPSLTFPTDPFSFQPGSGQIVANAYCVICHSADYIYMQPPHSQGKWTEIIKKMKQTFGCPIPKPSSFSKGTISIDQRTRQLGQRKIGVYHSLPQLPRANGER